jgi:phospholipid N-methyltransferase
MGILKFSEAPFSIESLILLVPVFEGIDIDLYAYVEQNNIKSYEHIIISSPMLYVKNRRSANWLHPVFGHEIGARGKLI